MKSFLLVFCLFVAGVEAGGKTLTFSSSNWKYTKYENSYFFIGVDAEVGTGPAQHAKARLFFGERQQNPIFANCAHDYEFENVTCDNNYNPNLSSSFVLDQYGIQSVFGYDNIKFDNTDLSLQKVYLSSDWLSCWQEQSALSLARSDTDVDGKPYASLVRDYLKSQDDKRVVIHFDNIGRNASVTATGTLTLGGVPDDKCNDDWQYVQTITGYNEWFMTVDRISVGKYEAVAPSGAFYIDHENFDIFMPDSVYINVVAQLNMDSYGFVDCNTTMNIKYLVESVTLTLQPEDFVDQDVQSGGRCRLRLSNASRDFTLPISFLRNKCLSLNFSDGHMGFASAKGVKSMNKVRRVGRGMRSVEVRAPKNGARRGANAVPRNKRRIIAGKKI